MAFNVTSFIDNAKKLNGFSRSNHFEVELTLPSFLSNKYSTNLSLAAVSVNLPGVSLDSSIVRRGSTTFKESFPINVNYSDLNISFLSDGQGQILNLFKDWIDFIFPVANVESASIPGKSVSVPYRNEYTSVLSINHFNSEGKKIMKYTFHDAWPEKTGDIPFNWGAFNEIVTLPVDFKYTYYTQIINP